MVSMPSPPRKRRSRLERIQADIVSCEPCQPYDKEDGKVFWCEGDRMSIEGLLTSHRVPEARFEEVATRLHCPNCGGTFAVDDDVGVRTSEDRDRERTHRDWVTRLAPRFADFSTYLERVPLLGARHSIGRRILKAVSRFPQTSVSAADEWWRGQVLKDGESPSAARLGPPPASECRSEGRFNHFGQRVFYVASAIDVAAAEALRQDEGSPWVMSWKLNISAPMLDLGAHLDADELHDDASYLAAGLTYIRPHLARASDGPWKPEYFVSRFIADAAREAGYKGIRYPSIRFPGDCLVLLEWDDTTMTPVGEPRQIQWNRKAAEAALPF